MIDKHETNKYLKRLHALGYTLAPLGVEFRKDNEPYFCTSCMQWKNIGSFYIRADGRVMTQCKTCQKAYKKAKAQK